MVPMGMLFGKDPLQELMIYMESQIPTYSLASTFFASIKKAILASPAYCGTVSNTDVTCGDIAYKVQEMWRPNVDTVEQSKTYQWLHSSITHFVQNVEQKGKGIPVDTDQAVTRLLEFLFTITNTEPTDIPDLIEQFHFDQYIESGYLPIRSAPKPDQYIAAAAASAGISLDKKSADVTPREDVAVSEPQETYGVPEEPVSPTPTQTTPSLQETVRQHFGAPLEELTDIAAVMTFLQEEATRTGDASIVDAVYFDEQTGALAWEDKE